MNPLVNGMLHAESGKTEPSRVSSGMLIIALLILVGGLVISDPDGALTNLATENFKQLQGSATTGIESRRSTR